jgi:UDP-2,3-diacylglucosamine pyrophosphatase LpxH
MLTSLADLVYRILQKLDRSHGIARKAKTTSKIFLRCLRKVRELSIAYAKRKGCTMVTCGHTHHAEAAWDEGVQYFNSGCWTEKPCTYLTIKAGIGRLYEFAPSEHETESASQKQEVRVEYSLN